MQFLFFLAVNVCTKKLLNRVFFFAVMCVTGLHNLPQKAKLHDMTIFLLHAFTAKKFYTNYNIPAKSASPTLSPFYLVAAGGGGGGGVWGRGGHLTHLRWTTYLEGATTTRSEHPLFDVVSEATDTHRGSGGALCAWGAQQRYSPTTLALRGSLTPRGQGVHTTTENANWAEL